MADSAHTVLEGGVCAGFPACRVQSSLHLDSDWTVWVKLPLHRKANGKFSHRFNYEKSKLKELGSRYDPAVYAWVVPDHKVRNETLEYLLTHTRAEVYIASLDEVITADMF